MTRVVQFGIAGVPALIAAIIALLGDEWPESHLWSARTWFYIALSAVIIVIFWGVVIRKFLPYNQVLSEPLYRPRWLLYGLAALSLGVPFVIILGTIAQPWWEPGDLLRDPLDIAAKRMRQTGSAVNCCGSEVGAVSLLGNLITIGAAAVMGFAGIQRALTVGKRDGGLILLALGALLATTMALDDLFRLHEAHQRKFVFFYMTVLGAIGCLSIRWLSRFENRFLVATAGFFVVSIVVDTVFKHDFGEYRVVIEDGAKLFGFCCLASFALTAGLKLSAATPANHQSRQN